MNDQPQQPAEPLAYDAAGFVVRTGDKAAVNVTLFCDSPEQARRALRRVESLAVKRQRPCSRSAKK